MSRITGFLKEVGATLATVTALVYVTGYLVLRARAHALGIEPDLKLVEEVYVFAGFRCLYAIAVSSLLVGPVWFGFRWLQQRVTPRIGTRVAQVLEILALAALFVACYLNLRILEGSGVLLRIGSPATHGVADRAILGDPIATWWMMGSVLVAMLTGSFLYDCSRRERRSQTGVLGLLLALQIVNLPVLHGALIADRSVRVIAQIPPSLGDLRPPLGVVDRSGEQVTLLARDRTGAPRLMAMPAAELRGLGISGIVPIAEFVQALSHGPQPKPALKPEVPPPPVPRVVVQNASLLASIEKRLRIVAIIGSLGESPIPQGEIWEASIDSAPPQRRRLSRDTDLAWPVASSTGGTVYALRKGELVAIERGRAAEPVASPLRWRKLLGVTPEGDVAGLAEDKAQVVPALFSARAVEVGVPSATPEERSKLARMLQDSRGYEGGEQLRSARSSRGSGFDVFLTAADRREINVSDCGDDSCAQASLVNGSHVLYVRQPAH